MTTTTYILTGAAGTQTHIDLGLSIGHLSYDGQSFQIIGSDGNNSFFLRPAGYSFDFTQNGHGDDAVYLTGSRGEYNVSIEDNVATLIRTVGETTETVIVSTVDPDTAAPSNMTLVFADGALTSDMLSQTGGEPLDPGRTSVDFTPPEENTGGVRVGTIGAQDQTNVFGFDGLTFTAIGNGGVDEVFVTAGASVDATKLGVGQDRIYLEGSWAQYTKTLQGNQITLTRTVVKPLSDEEVTEVVKVIGGVGASNDRLLFADGSVNTYDMYTALWREGLATDITTDSIWDSQDTSFSSAAALEGEDVLTLALDSGVAADDWITNDGVVNISGFTEGYIRQYSVDGGATWTPLPGTETSEASFTLEGQASGDAGVEYAAGEVQVRQINPFGVASAVVSNAQVIIVDKIAEAASITIDNAPTLIEGSVLDDQGNLTLTGMLAPDMVSLELRWNNGDPDTDDLIINATLDEASPGVWLATILKDQLEAMPEGEDISFSLVATDSAGNEADAVTLGPVRLELANDPPEINSDLEIAPQVFAVGEEGAADGGTVILDLTDLDGNPATDDAAFIDADAPASENGTLTYTAAWNGGPLPSWLAFTGDGVLRLVQGAAAPVLEGGPITLVVTATDGAGESVSRDIVIDTLAAPALLPASDTGASTQDNITNHLTPTIEGDLPAGANAETVITIYRGGQPIASNDGSDNGLTLDYENGAWSYTPPDDLAEDEHTFTIEIDHVRSPELQVTIDATAAPAPTIEMQLNALVLNNSNGEGAEGAQFDHVFGTNAAIAGWVYIGDADGRTASGSESQMIFDTGGDMSLRIALDGKILLSVDGAWADTGFTASEGWRYIAVTRSPEGQSVYLDGVESSESFAAAGAAPGFVRLGIGSEQGVAPLIDGAFRDLQVWNSALDAAALEDARNGAPVDTGHPDLAGYWPLAEAGPGALANSANGNDLVALGGAEIGPFDDSDGFSGVVTAGATPVIKGAGAEPDARITVTAQSGDEIVTASTTVAADGTWRLTLQFDSVSSDGYTITATQTDVAGNESAVSNALVIRSPLAPRLDPASDTGVAGDNITLDRTPTITGDLPEGYASGEAFSIRVNGVVAATVTDDNEVDGLSIDLTTGKWEYTPQTPLSIGDNTFQTSYDGVFSGTLVVSVEGLTAPVLDPASDTGVSNTDKLTKDATPTVTGDLPAGVGPDSVVRILVNGEPKATVTGVDEIDGLFVGGDGAWRYTPTTDLLHGDHEFILEVDGVRSEPLTVSIDLVAETVMSPDMPDATVAAAVFDNASLDPDGGVFSGLRAPFFDSGSRATIMARVFIANPATGGEQTIYALDPGGDNDSLHWIYLSSDGEFLIKRKNSSHAPERTGVFAETGWHHIALVQNSSGVDFYLNGEKIAETSLTRYTYNRDMYAGFGYTADGAGDWNMLVDGAYKDIQIWKAALDAEQIAAASAGAQVDLEDSDLWGSWSLTESFKNDLLGGDPIRAYTNTAIDIIENVTGNSTGVVLVSSSQLLKGTGVDPGATITVTLSDGAEEEVLTTVADASGAWTISLTLDEGVDYALTITQTDLAGNVSEARAPLTLRVDPGIFPDPALPRLDPDSDSGVLGDNATTIRTPTIRGDLPSFVEDGGALVMLVNGVWTGAFGDSGTTGSGIWHVDYDERFWTYTPEQPLSTGAHEFLIRMSREGVGLIASPPLTVSIVEGNVTITEQPEIVQASAFDDNDNLAVRVEGDAQTAAVTVSWEGGPSAEAQFDEATRQWTAVFSKTDMEAMPDGAAARFSVTARDVRGIILAEAQSDDIAVEFSNQAPARNDDQEISLQLAQAGEAGVGGAPVLDLWDINRDGGDTTNDAAFIDPDAPGSDNATLRYAVTLKSDGSTPDWLEVTRAGVVQVVEGMTPPALTAPITVTVTATDEAGLSVSRDIQISTLQAPVLKPGLDSGVSDSDNITDETRPILSGELPPGVEAGTTVAIYLNDGGDDPVAAGAGNGDFNGLYINYDEGRWEYAAPTALDDGVYVFEVKVGDFISAPLTVTVDTMADQPTEVEVAGEVSAIVLDNPDNEGRDRARALLPRVEGDTTIAAWVYIDSFSAPQTIFALNPSEQRFIGLEGTDLVLETGSGYETLHSNLTQGWHHIAFTHSSEGSALYLNGVKSSAPEEIALLEGGVTQIQLGQSDSPDYRSLINGAYRNVGVWSRSFDEAEIADLFVGDPVNLEDSGLVGWWPLDLASGLDNQKSGALSWTDMRDGGQAEIAIHEPVVAAGHPVISGAAEPYASVTVTADNGVTVITQNVTAGADGAWTVTLALPPGAEYEVSARQQDLAGNVSDASAVRFVRTSFIEAPVLLSEPDAFTNDATPALTGVLSAGVRPESEIVILRDGAPVASGSAAGASGGLEIDYRQNSWTYTPADDLSDNEYEFTVSIGGAVSPAFIVTVDTDPPAAPTVLTPFSGLVVQNEDSAGADGAEIAHQFGAAATIAGWVYIGDSDGATSSGSQVQTIFGVDGDMEVTIAVGGAVMLSAGGVAVDTGFSASQGWHYIAVTRDAAGQSFYFNNEKSASNFSTLGAAPTRLRLGLDEADGNRPLIGGAFSRLQLWNRALSEGELDDGFAGAAPNTADTDLVGYWPFSTPGAGGLDNEKQGGLAFNPLGGAAVEVWQVGGNPVIRGAGAEPGATITVTASDGATAPSVVTAVVDPDGAWSVTLPLAASQTTLDYAITVTQTDKAGNESVAVMETMRISPDVIGPPVLDAGADTGVQGDNVTLDATPTVRGALPPDYMLGEDFIVYVNGVEVARANSAEESGGLLLDFGARTWTYTRPDTEPFDPGEYAVQGGFGGETAPALTVSVIRPQAPDLEDASDSGVSDTDNITNIPTPTLSGTLPVGTTPGSEPTLLMNGEPVTGGFTINFEDASWRYRPAERLDDGVYEFVLEVDGVPSAPLAVTIDTGAAEPDYDAEISALVLSGDGADEARVEIDPSFSHWSSSISIAGWVYIEEPTSQETTARRIIDFSDRAFSFTLNINDEGRISPANSAVYVSPGWNYFAITIDPSQNSSRPDLNHYWNGELISSHSGSVSRRENEKVYLGSDENGSRHFPDVAFRDLLFLRRTLSASEIEAMWQGAPVDLNDSALSDYWPFDASARNVAGGQNMALRDGAESGIVSDGTGFNAAIDLMRDDGGAYISGDAEPGSKITVVFENDATRIEITTQSDEAGEWRVEPSLIPGSDYTVTVTQEDLAGNISNPTIFTLSAPSSLEKPDLIAEDDKGASNEDNITSVLRPTLEGDLPPGVEEGALVEIFQDGEVVATTAPGGAAEGLVVDYDARTWRYQPPSDLAPGEYEFQVAADLDVSEALPVTIVSDFSGDVSILDAPFDTATALVTNNSVATDNGGALLAHQFGSDATVSAWVYIADPAGDDIGDQQLIFHTFADMTVQLEGGEVRVYSGGQYRETGIHIEEAGWYHMTVADSASGANFYIAGDAFETPQSFTGMPSENGGPAAVAFGRHRTNSQRAFDGAFRDIQVWDRMLSAEEVEAARNGVVDFEDPQLVGYWPMDLTSGSANAVRGGEELTVSGGAAIEGPEGGIIETAGEDVVIAGEFTGDVFSIRVAWDDGDGQGTDEMAVNAEIDRENMRWTATFTQAQLQQLTEGSNLTFKFVATDFAGNTMEGVTRNMGLLEATNEAPQVNDDEPIAEVNVIVEEEGGAGGTILLDLNDLAGDGNERTDDTAFTDADLEGSQHGRLEYSAMMKNGDPLPSWLQLTQEGVLKLVQGEAAANTSPLTVTVTVTDGAGATAARDIVVNPVLELTSVMNGENELDVRSDIVVETTLEGYDLAFATKSGDYKISITELNDDSSKGGFGDDAVNAVRTITMTVGQDGSVSFDGGEVAIVDGRAVIDFGQDLDLSTTFGLQVQEGFFVSVQTGIPTPAIDAGAVRFSTVTPSEQGERATVWDASAAALVEGAVWYDGTGGDFAGNDIGLSADLADVAAVVAIGHDMDATSDISLGAQGRTRLTGFGGDDLIYVDRAAGHEENDLSVSQITIGNTGGDVTTLAFTGEQKMAGVLISFADNPETPYTDSLLAASAFADRSGLREGEHTFLDLTGNGAPVISG